MKKHKAVIVDDEKNNIQLLNHFIENYCEHVEVVGLCSSVIEAYSTISKHAENLILYLDVELGSNEDGFQLIELLKGRNDQVIIVSAYPDYAIKAFRYATADFITKPVRVSDLIEATNRAISRLSSERSNGKMSHSEVLNTNDQIAIHLYNKVVFINMSDIVGLNSNGRNTDILLVDNQKLDCIDRIGEVEQKLDSNQFFRPHKSYVVNLKHIKSILYENDVTLIEMVNEIKVPVARRKKRATYTILGLKD